MKLVVVGCGSIGVRHVRNLRALGVASVLAVDPAPERRAAAEEAGAVGVSDLETALAARPDAAVICTPPHAHIAPAHAAVRAGLDVFVEKPLAATLAGVDGLLREAAQRGRILCVGYNLRFHPGLLEIRRLLEAGAIGRPLAFRGEFGQYLPDWRPEQDYRRGYNAQAAMGGGIVLDASHEIDYARWLLGEVHSVAAITGRVSALEIDVEDLAVIILRFEKGAIGSLHLDSVQRAYARGCKIIGEDGTLEWSAHEGVRVYTVSSAEWRGVPIAVDPNATYVEEMRRFLACVRRTAPPAVSGEDGRRVLEIALAVNRAAEERREVAIV